MFKKISRGHRIVFALALIVSGCLVSKPAVTSFASDTNTASKIVFVQSPGSGSADSIWASQPVLEIQNANGEVITSGADSTARITISLPGNNGSLKGTATVLATQGRGRFVGLSSTLAGNFQLQAKKHSTTEAGGSGELVGNSNTFEIRPGAMTKLNIQSDKLVYDLATCQKLDIQSVDKNNNPVAASEAVFMNLSSSSEVSFFSDSTCSSEIVSSELPANQKKISVYYTSTSHESINVFAAPVSASVGSGQLELAPEVLKITGHYQSLTKDDGACTAFGHLIVACKMAYGSRKIFRFPAKIKSLALGFDFSLSGCAVLETNELYCFGDSADGSPYAAIPKKMTVFTEPVQDILAGYGYYCALVKVSTRNEVKCWGRNTQKQLGDGTTINRTVPVSVGIPLTGSQSVVKIKMFKNENSILSSYSVIGAILNDGKIYSWGALANPTLLAGTYDAVDGSFVSNSGSSSPVVTENSGCVLNRDGTVGCWGSNRGYRFGGTFFSPTSVVPIDLISNVKSIDIGINKSCATKPDNSRFCWGQDLGFKFEPMADKISYNSKGYSYSSYTDIPLQIDGYVPKADGDVVTGKGSAQCSVDTILNQVLCVDLFAADLAYSYSFVDFFQKKVFLSMANNLFQKDTCTEVTASLKKNGSETVADKDFVFSPEDLDGVGRFFVDGSCAVEAKKITLFEGSSRTRFFFKAPNAGTRSKMTRLRLNEAQLPSSILASEVVGNPIGINLLKSNPNLSYTCQEYPFSLIDESGNSVVMTQDYVISTPTSPNQPGFNQYSDSNCTPGNETNSVTIPRGQSSANLYIKITFDCGSVPVTYHAPGLMLPTQTRTYSVDNCDDGSGD